MSVTSIVLASDDFWFKSVEFLQQNWALLEKSDGAGVHVFFLDDNGYVFDQMEFACAEAAHLGLRRNGFIRLAEDVQAQGFLKPPQAPYQAWPHPNGRIYSSGRFWLEESLARDSSNTRVVLWLERSGRYLFVRHTDLALSLPGGALHHGELPIVVAARCLFEQTGFTATSLARLFAVTSGVAPIEVFRAQVDEADQGRAGANLCYLSVPEALSDPRLSPDCRHVLPRP